MQTKLFLRIISVFLLLFFFSCSTKKNTQVTRTFHNINSHYNVYFNANEALKEGIDKIETNFIDNYTTVLTIYKFGDKASASTANSDMETVLKKTAKLIKKHSIKKKPKRKNSNKKMSKKDKEFYSKTEYVKWVDDAYLLMGKAHFYKQEYTQAIRIFEFVIQNFSDIDLKLQAQIWIARSYSEQQDFRSARIALDALRGMKQTKKKVKKQIALVTADYYLKQNNYAEGIPQLKIAIRETRKKREKGRYTFILAQIYQEDGNYKKATELYAKIPKLDPTYEMQFNANINSAVAFSGNSKGDDIIKVLRKMLKDEKNEDFKDQIYYALANIYIKKDDLQRAKNYFRLSSASSTKNKNQKAISCLALADIYFVEPEYKLAQAYYDSTIINLDKQYPDYEYIYVKTKNLTSLVNNLTTIKRQDSLQIIAKMSESDRIALIDQKIQDYKAEEARKKAEAQNALNSNRDPIFDDDIKSSSTFNSNLPFFDPASAARGMDMFKRKWGDRKLEDNWRRKNKAVILEENDINTENNKNVSDEFTQEDREYYLTDLPLTDSLIEQSDIKIEKAYANAGEIYMDKLEDKPEAIKIYEEMNKRFPNGKYLLDSYYNLYRMNKELGNTSEVDKYKDLIIKTFPKSSHAKLFTNPNYLNEINANKKEINEVYYSAYDNYKANKYSEAITISKLALTKFPENYIEPKFEFIIALSISALAAPDATVLQQELKKIVTKFPKTEEAYKADEMLQALNSSKGEEFTSETDIYSEKESRNYYYAIILTNSFNINGIRFDIAKFNINNFSRIDFEVSDTEFRKSEKIILVKGITDLEIAKEYFSKIKKDSEMQKDLGMENYQEFVISEENYKVFELDKNIKRYIFFMNNTLKIK